MSRFGCFLLSVILLLNLSCGAAGPRPVVLAEGYEHDRFVTLPRDQVREFRAYTTSFDGADGGVSLGVPEWVAYEVQAAPLGLGAAPGRPSRWFTDEELFEAGIAPNDDTYRGSGYSRGHLCMKSLAWRLGADADYNTHTVLNACPQLQELNAGAWLHLEELTGEWADAYERVWILCGPVFLKAPLRWIGDEDEAKAAIPDAFYKIVIREGPDADTPETLAFLFPHSDSRPLRSRSGDLTPYLTSIDIIEALTRLDFLTGLEDAAEDAVEQEIAAALWPGEDED